MITKYKGREVILKAAVWYAKKDIRIVDVAEPVPQRGQVKVKVKWCGICGSDLHEYSAGPVFIPVDTHPLTGQKAPMILGHEFSGEIAEVGENVTGWQKGERVAVDPALVCMNCFWCKRYIYNACANGGFIGAHMNGGFAEYTCVPAYTLYKLEDNVTFEEGALMEPLCVAAHAVRRSGLKIGDTAVIIGAGTIGLFVLQSVKAAGASKIFVIEVSEKRKNLALEMGATKVLDPKKDDIIKEVKGLTKDIGADIVFECVGLEKTLRQAIDMSRKSGKIITVGIHEKEASLDYNKVVISMKTIIGTFGCGNLFGDIMPLVADGRIETKNVISKKIKLDNIVDHGLKELIEKKDDYIKILVSP